MEYHHGIHARHGADAHAADSTMSDSMSGMSGNGGGGMTMMSVFQTSMATPLYSQAWTPTSTGSYAGTCIFLIVLAVIFRGLLAAKWWQENRWLDRELNRRFVVVNGKAPLAENLSRDSLAKHANMVLSENGIEENVVVVKKRTFGARPWRLSVDPVRAAIDTVIAGVGYLLMLAVMSMNVGYFLSILAGTFIGSLLVGRFITSAEH
ncbi:protein P80 [Echria macrotheca]|uniref:Copper transport protein n=1 Tax=Echria macrotheca TaxID=438768 RepID=A0AAJ0BHN6_9PEZI|nr:protein P80 [Echria macrotheca]